MHRRPLFKPPDMSRADHVEYQTPDDRDAWVTALRRAAPQERRYARAISRLMDVFNDRRRLAREARTPAEKVEHLEAAKGALAELADCQVPGSRFRFSNLEAVRTDLERLELTYRAFGYYRMAGRG